MRIAARAWAGNPDSQRGVAQAGYLDRIEHVQVDPTAPIALSSADRPATTTSAITAIQPRP